MIRFSLQVKLIAGRGEESRTRSAEKITQVVVSGEKSNRLPRQCL